MPRECRNFNNVGKVSGLLLLLLVFLAINPIASSAAFAEEDSEDAYYETSFDSSDDVDDVATLDAAGESTVGISFSPATYYADLAPTNMAGQSARIDLTATVNVYNSGGYAVYLKSNNGAELVGVNNSSNTIPSMGATTATYANMPVNTWGYASNVGTSVPNTAAFKSIAVSGNGDKLAENTSDDIETDTKTIALSFATKINDAKPADTYSNTMMLSVVSSPAQAVISWDEMTTMQEMTTKACTNAGIGASKQLKDTRDGKFYWVGKLADGKCWMTQNLDLDLSTDPGETSTGTIKTFTNADTDLNTATSWTPTSGTYTKVGSSTILADNTGQRSWSLGDYRITNPIVADDCGNRKADLASCAGTDNSRFSPYATPTSANGDIDAHYIVGNYYQWVAATAGTSSNDTDNPASSSICPKGWRLPTAYNSAIGSFRTLIIASAIDNDVTKFTSSPYYFVRGGGVGQYTTNLFNKAGGYGNYWTSTPYTDSTYRLYFGSTISSSSVQNDSRYSGYSVRCLAR